MLGLNKKKTSRAGLSSQWKAELGDHVIRLAWSPDGKLLAAALVGGPVAIFHGETGERIATLPGHNVGTTCLSWRFDSAAIATGGQDGKVRVWNPETADLLAAMEAGSPWVEEIAYGPGKDILISAAGKVLRAWKISGDLLTEFEAHPSTISDIAWQADTPYFTSVTYGQLAMFRYNEAAPSRKFEWKGSILRVAWSPDGNFVATGNQDASVHFWYRKSGKDLEMSGYASKVREISWDAGSRYLATGGSPVVTIWDCAGKGPAGSRPIQLEGHEAMLNAITYQHRGSLLASGCRKGDVCLWDPAVSETRLALVSFGTEVTQLRWTPNDQKLAGSTASGTVEVWKVGTNG